MDILLHKNRSPTLYVDAILINLGHSYTNLCLWLDICLNGFWEQCYLWSERVDTGSDRLICCPGILFLECWLWRYTYMKIWNVMSYTDGRLSILVSNCKIYFHVETTIYKYIICAHNTSNSFLLYEQRK